MDQVVDQHRWLEMVGLDDCYHSAIVEALSRDAMSSGDSVENLARTVGALIVVVGVTSADRRYDEVRQLAAEPNTYPIALADHVDVEVYVRLLESGARGVAHLDDVGDNLAAVAAAALRHDYLLPASVMQSLLDRPRPDRLSDTSFQILRWLDAGQNAKQIASRLNVSGRTARRRIHNLYMTLGADSAASAVSRAHELGLIDTYER